MPQTKIETSTGNKFNFIPTRKFRLPVDSALVLRNGTVSGKDRNLIVPALEWTYNRNNMGKSAMIVMDILANNNWERPIYFASLGHEGTLGLEDYMQLDGFAYRLVPIRSESLGRYEASRVESNLLYENLMNKFRWGGMNDPDVYLDDFHVRTTSVVRLRTRFIQLATALINKSDTTRALEVLDRCLEITPNEKVPFDYNIIQIAGAYYKCKKLDKGNELVEKMGFICDEKLNYYLDQKPEFIAAINDEILYNLQVLQNMINLSKTYYQEETSAKLELIAEKHYTDYNSKTATMR
jgi:hypothetical protein